jgi:Putative phage tail protein
MTWVHDQTANQSTDATMMATTHRRTADGRQSQSRLVIGAAERRCDFFWLLLLLFVATTVVGALLAPHPRGPQPSALGDFSVPTATEGRAIPVVFGTCIIKGGNTVWWGDLKSKAIRVSSGILSFGQSQITGYKYYLGCQFMLCHGPVDAVVDIQADVKSIPRTATTILNGNGSENYIQVNANGPNLFGGTGPGGGGGIAGTINFYRGLDTQQPDFYLSAKQGRIVLDQSGIGYTFHGTGNGTMTAESAGVSSLDETITITAVGIDTNPAHSTFQKMKFTVSGSVSGSHNNSVANLEGSNSCWADQAFSCSVINFTITTGSTQYAIGDVFIVVTGHSHVAPAYRRLCYAVFQQLYVGTSNYLKPLAFVVRRCPDPLAQGAGVANISGDANPALAVYELLNNIDYGLGIPGARIDATSFSAAAVTLASEGLGISMQFDTQASADQLIGEVLRHCDGLLYTDPATGLWTITLARGGYDPTLLPVLTVDNVLATPDFSRGSWSETTNLVGIRFASRSNNFNDRLVKAYDAANISVTGEVRPQTIDFKGISSETAAALVAIRVLKTLTYPLSKIKLVTNRTAWQFRPGGLFRFTWVPLGIINQVFRITRIGYGELTDGKISIDAVEDIFGINSVAFVAPPSSGWVNPVGVATPCSHQQMVEMPLDLESVANGNGYVALCMAARDPAVFAQSYEIWENDGSGFYDTGNLSDFCPFGTLTADYGPNTVAIDPTGFTVAANGVDLIELASVISADMHNGVNLVSIDAEIMSWQTVTANGDGTYTISGVMRGQFDTVPADHAPGAAVWFFSSGSNIAKLIASSTPGTITTRFTPQNSFGQLPVSSASDVTLTTVGRMALPYPPGNVRMQGQAYGTRYTTILGSLVLTWSTRNNGAQVGRRPLVPQDQSAISLPFGGGTVIDYLIAAIGGDVVALADQVVGNTGVTITADQRIAFGSPQDRPLKLKIRASLAGPPYLESYQSQIVQVTFTGFGMQFGLYFGGIQQ